MLFKEVKYAGMISLSPGKLNQCPTFQSQALKKFGDTILPTFHSSDGAGGVLWPVVQGDPILLYLLSREPIRSS